MMKKVAILQSNYIPWKGYFDIINAVDEFIILDEVQYTKNDWRNRNKIKTPQGTEWISMPVSTKGKFGQSINETQVSNSNWAEVHWKTLKQNYNKSLFFSEFETYFLDIYSSLKRLKLLSEINYLLIKEICNFLNIKTVLRQANEFELLSEKTERLVSICLQTGATHYISGPSGSNYMEVKLFQKAGIEVEYYNYEGYPEHRQLYPPFEHGVTILDLVFNEGKNAPLFMKSFKSSCL